MEKQKVKNKEIVIPVIVNDYSVVVCWGDSLFIHKVLKAWWFDWSHKKVKEELADKYGATFLHFPISPPVIALPKPPRTNREIGTLTHEVYHALTHIFNQIGEESRDEVFANCLGGIVAQVLKQIRNRKR